MRSHKGMTHNIALMGRARSGKDTIAARLVEEHGYTRVAFADPLKRMALSVDPIVYSEPYECDGRLYTEEARLSAIVQTRGWEYAKDTYPEARRILQHVGQTVRDLDPGFWVNMAMDAIGDVAGPVVVTDVRYPNEAKALRARGFRLVRVVRPGQDLVSSHASETALDNYWPDAVVVNAGSLSELHIRTDALAA